MKTTLPKFFIAKTVCLITVITLFFVLNAHAQFTATWAMTSDNSVAVTGAQSANITAGTMTPGANFTANGSFGSNGYLAKQTLGNWPTVATDSDNLDFPLSPNGAVNVTITGVTLTAKTSNSSGANIISLAYQVDGIGSWTAFGSPQSASSGGTTNINFGTLNTLLPTGHTYIIRAYIYAAGGSTTSSRTVSVKNFVVLGSTAPLLPITLVYFNGQKTNNGNTLNWSLNCTSTKINIQVQHSTDQKNYTTISSIDADQVRCSQPFYYTDEKPSAINYYRLKLMDIDGKLSYSSVTAIINADHGTAIVSAYPTVASNELFLKVTSADNSSVKTMITDMNAKTISITDHIIYQGNNVIRIDCSSLNSGTYIITGITKDAVSKTMRFIKL